MMALLLEPLQFTFMSHALLISLVVSIPCALLSVFLVLKGWALMGDAMSHAVFPGIVLAWILRLPLATAALLLNVLSRRFFECSRALSSVICTTSMSEGSQTMV